MAWRLPIPSRPVPMCLMGRMVVDGRANDVVMRSDVNPWSQGKPPKAVRQSRYPGTGGDHVGRGAAVRRQAGWGL